MVHIKHIYSDYIDLDMIDKWKYILPQTAFIKHIAWHILTHQNRPCH